MSLIELRFGMRHVDLTDEQARACLEGPGRSWTAPEVPDASIDADDTLIEREDGRPRFLDDRRRAVSCASRARDRRERRKLTGDRDCCTT